MLSRAVSYKRNDIFNHNYEEECEELPKTFKECLSKIHKIAEIEKEQGNISRGLGENYNKRAGWGRLLGWE